MFSNTASITLSNTRLHALSNRPSLSPSNTPFRMLSNIPPGMRSDLSFGASGDLASGSAVGTTSDARKETVAREKARTRPPWRKPEGFENQVLTVIPPTVLEHAKKHPLLEPFYITDVGYFPHAQHHYRERTNGCDEHILIYCVQGRGFVEACGKRHTIVKNSALIIPKGVPHAYGALTESDPWHIYWAHYTGSHAHLYNPGPPDDVFTFPVPAAKLAEFTRLFHVIFEALERGITITNMIVSAHALKYILTQMLFAGRVTSESSDRHGNPSEGPARQGAQYVEDAISYMQSRLHENINLSELASWLNLSKGHLTQLFKEHTGYPPLRFFINLKMQQACRYLDLTDMTVKQVAAKLGYTDPCYFSRLFTKTIGMSPSEYRSIAKG